MKITSVALENIATHVKTRIPFMDGINVLSGLNGAGKSTVLKMIGYAMFDYLAGNQADYVRHGESSGTVTVYFTGKDGTEYSLKRNIGGGNTSPRATNLMTGMEVNFASRKDAFTWIHDQMGIDRSVDLKSLFQNSIGVDQGTFTIPFSKPAGERKKIFGPVLNVDVYEQAYKNAHDITNALKNDIQNLAVKISGLQGEISSKHDLQEELNNFQKDLADLGNQQTLIGAELARLKAEVQSMDTLKDRRDALRSERKTLESTINEMQKAKDRIEKELGEARQASVACNATRADYMAYEDLGKQERDLQPRLATLESVRKQCNGLETELLGTKKLIAEIAARIKQIEADMGKLPGLERSSREHSQLVDRISSIGAELRTIDAQEKELKDLKKKHHDLQEKLDRQKVDDQEVARLQAATSQLDQVERERIKLVEHTARLRAAISQATENMHASKDGKCPFLKDACKNIQEQSLGQYFQKQIDALNASLAIEAKSLDDAMHTLDGLKTAKTRLETLLNLKEQATNLRGQLDDLQGRIKSIEAAIANRSSLETQRKEATARKESLEPAVQAYALLKGQVEIELPDLRTKIADKEAYVIKIEEAIKPLKKYIGDLDGIQTRLDDIRKSMAAKRGNHEVFMKNSTLAEKLPSIEANVASMNKRFDESRKKLDNTVLVLAEVESRYDEKRHDAAKAGKDKASSELAAIGASITEKNRNVVLISEKLKKIEEKSSELNVLTSQHDELVAIDAFNTTLREWFKQAGPIITKALMYKINEKANQFIKDLSGSNDVKLEWKEDFDAVLTTPLSVKSFNQLSGGEQMAVALSIRLAILRVLSNLDFAFFDEPTTNLDPEKRENLAQCIKNVGMSKGFTQLFVISHDDTFERYADSVVHFSKDAEENTTIDVPSA